MKCSVCGSKSNVSVCNSVFGAVSFAYCTECLQHNREPYGAMIGSLLGIRSLDEIADWIKPYIVGTLTFYDKTETDLLADIKEATDDYLKRRSI